MKKLHQNNDFSNQERTKEILSYFSFTCNRYVRSCCRRRRPRPTVNCRGDGCVAAYLSSLLARFSEVDLLDTAGRCKTVVPPEGVVALDGTQRSKVVAGSAIPVAILKGKNAFTGWRRWFPHRALRRMKLRWLGYQDWLGVSHFLLGEKLWFRW